MARFSWHFCTFTLRGLQVAPSNSCFCVRCLILCCDVIVGTCVFQCFISALIAVLGSWRRSVTTEWLIKQGASQGRERKLHAENCLPSLLRPPQTAPSSSTRPPPFWRKQPGHYLWGVGEKCFWWSQLACVTLNHRKLLFLEAVMDGYQQMLYGL